MSTPGELLEALGREARARFGNGGDAQTRVYRGRSVEELVPQIQRELGADAIIVRRREGLTGGVMGFFQRAFVEIEAMPGGPGVDVYDEDAAGTTPEAQPSPHASARLASSLAPSPAATAAAAPTVELPAVPLAEHPAAPEYRADAPAPPPVAPAEPPLAALAPEQFVPSAPSAPPAPPSLTPPPAAPPRPMLGYAPAPPAPERAAGSSPFGARGSAVPSAGAGSAYVTAHLAALARADRSRVAPRPSSSERPGASRQRGLDFADAGGLRGEGGVEERTRAGAELSARELSEPFAPAAERAPAQPWTRSERREVAPGSQGRARTGVARSLQRSGIGEELARELIDSASAHALALAPRAGLAQAVRATLAQRIPVAPPLPSKGAAIVVVGAGGAGKTTCCAALLGAYRKGSSLPASFATITRASASSAKEERGELQIVLSPYIMKPSPARAPRALRAVGRARGDGVTVLDTPSVSPSDRTGIRELARLLGELKPERVVVALPATLGATAAAQLLQALKPLGANALAITHADETDQLGVAVEAACRFGLAPEYMLEGARAGGWRLRQVGPSALAERL
jgi:flagellar biosynthesis GTPase FlhF